MNKEVISDVQGICLVILFISGSTLALPTAPAAGSDLWIAILLAIIIAIPLYLAYSRLLSLYPGNDLFDILEKIFGKVFGKLLGLVFTCFAFHLGVMVLREQGDYLITLSLPETPIMIPMLIVIFLCVFAVKEGIETLGRWAKLFVIFNAPIPTITILLLIPQMDFNNIQPILFDGIRPLMEGTLQALIFPFGDVVIFLMVFFALKTKKSSYNALIKGLLLGGIMIAGVSLAEVLVLGKDLYAMNLYPNHTVAAKVSIGETLHRLEVISIIATLTSIFLKISICLLAACNGVAKIFGFDDYRFIVIPVALLMCNVSYFIYGTIEEKSIWVNDFTVYYFLPIQIILPILILIAGEINTRRINRIDNGKA